MVETVDQPPFQTENSESLSPKKKSLKPRSLSRPLCLPSVSLDLFLPIHCRIAAGTVYKLVIQQVVGRLEGFCTLRLMCALFPHPHAC
jgi:hypothetical protein